MNALMGDGVPLVVFDEFDWTLNEDGTYSVEAWDDANQKTTVTASINDAGQLSVVFNGTITISGLGSVTLSIDAAIDKYVEGTTDSILKVYISDSKLELEAGTESGLSASVLMTIFDDEYTGTYEWTTSDNAVVEITSGGNGSSVTIKAVGAGTATITVTVGDKSATCTVTVPEPEATITDATISGATIDELKYDANSTEQPDQAEISLTITMSDGSAFAGTVEWKSSDENVVKVDGNGTSATITVVGAGTATITATVEGWETPLTCEVTVTDVTVTAETPRLTTPAGEITWGRITWDANAQIALSEPTDMGDYILYEVSGSASEMTGPQADAYWDDTAREGDLYVYIEVVVHPGETMTWSNGSHTNNGEVDEIGRFVVGVYNDKQWSFTISYTGENGETVTETYVVSFEGIENLPWVIHPEINVASPREDADTTLGGVEFTVSDDLGVALDYVEDRTGMGYSYTYWVNILVTGTSSAMTAPQAVAWVTTDVTVGTQYVVIEISLQPNESIDYQNLEDKTNNTEEVMYDGVIVKLGDNGEGFFQYKLTDAKGVVWMYCLEFHMTPSEVSEEDMAFSTASADELARALEIGVTQITITADVTDTNDSTIITAINNVLADAASADEAVTVIINLGGKTLDTSGSSYGIVVGNYNTLEINGDNGKLILWTNASSDSQKSDGAIYVDSGSTLIINDTIVTSTGTAIFPRAYSSKVEVNGSVIYTTGYYGISTNAGTGMSDKVTIEVTNSLVYANEDSHDCAAIMLNVEGTLEVTGSCIVGGRQGIILRANDSVATIKDTVVAVSGEYASSPYANEDGTPVDNKLWSSGNEVPNAAVVLGNNTTSTSWDGTTTVEFEGVTLKVLADTPASAYFLLYAYSNKEENSVAITMTGEGNNFSVEYLGLNDGVYAGVGEGGVITVDEVALKEKVVYEDLYIDIANVFSITSDTSETTISETTLLGQSASATVNVTATSSSTVKYDYNSKGSFTGRLKLSGAGKTTQRSIEFVLTEAADITVWIISSSSSESRIVNLFDANGNTVYQKIGVGGSDITVWTMSVEAGTYYLGSASSAINLYAIKLSEYTGNYVSDTPATAESWEVTVTPSEVTLSADNASATVSAAVTLNGEDVTSSVVLGEWKATDTSVVTVDKSTGVITAVGVGSTTVTVTFTYGNGDNMSITCTVNVTVTSVPEGN